MKIGFIGLGNMAKAIIGGMLQNEMVKPGDIVGSAKTEKTLKDVQTQFGIEVRTSNLPEAKSSRIFCLPFTPEVNFFTVVVGLIFLTISVYVLIILSASSSSSTTSDVMNLSASLLSG